MEGLRPKRESESLSVVSDSLRPHGLHSPWNSPGKNTGVGSLSLLQGIFPTQGLNPGLPHCRWILHQLSHQGRLSHLPVLPLPQAFYSFLELPSRMPDSSISLISFMFSFPLSLSAVLLTLFSPAFPLTSSPRILLNLLLQFSQFSRFGRSVVSDPLRPHESQHARPPCPSPAPRVYSNPCPSSR